MPADFKTRLLELLAELRGHLDDLEESERGWVPYCDDPEDGCDELWREEVDSIEKVSAVLVSHCRASINL